ncbi:hypothetical protein NMG60_11017191 [Bertholletia excelsa]
MSERAKRRKSLWDSKEEHPLLAQNSQKDAWRRKESYSSFDPSSDTKLSDLEATNVLKSEEFYGQRTRKLSQGNSAGRGWQNPGSPESSWSKSYRYNRHRTRSLDRDGGRSRSRSRSQSRSRSRSRSRDRRVSRSPFEDHRGDLYEWSDRRIGSGISSRPCRDFAAGNCRRGRQCRFLHQENLSHRDGRVGAQLEKDQVERWPNRQEYRGNDYNMEKDEPLRHNDKTSLCADFLEGRCLRGSSCRHSHHDASGDNDERCNRNMLIDKDSKSQLHNNNNIPCRYFMMGKCHMDNCKFSHDCMGNGNLKGRPWPDSWGHDLDDMNKSWNGPKHNEDIDISINAWPSGCGNVGNQTSVDRNTDEKRTDHGYNLNDKNKVSNSTKEGDATSVLKLTKSIGFRNYSVENIKSTNPTNEKYITGRQDVGLDSEGRIWECSVRKDEASKGEESMSPDWVSGSHLMHMGIPGSKDAAKSFNREAPSLPAHSLQGQTFMGVSKDVYEHNSVRKPSSSESSQIQQHQGKIFENVAITEASSSDINKFDMEGNSRHPVIVPGKMFNQTTGSFSSQPQSFGGIDQNQRTISMKPSSEHNIDPRGPVQHNTSFNLQNQTQIHCFEAVKTLVNLNNPPNVANVEQAMQIASLAASLTQVFGDGQLNQLYAALNPSACAELGSALSKSILQVSNGSMDAQPDQNESHRNPLGSIVELCKSDSCDEPPGFSSSCIEQKHKILTERSSPSSTVGPDSGNSELKGEKPVANSVIDEENKPMAEKCQNERENIDSENVDTDGKVGEGNNGKDEKALRLFKNALVEFVKEVLKPKWKEGQISREVHKTIVKKVVDKVTSTFHGDNIPKTQNKVDQYLSFSKSKLTKLVEAYMERSVKSS